MYGSLWGYSCKIWKKKKKKKHIIDYKTAQNILLITAFFFLELIQFIILDQSLIFFLNIWQFKHSIILYTYNNQETIILICINVSQLLSMWAKDLNLYMYLMKSINQPSFLIS